MKAKDSGSTTKAQISFSKHGNSNLQYCGSVQESQSSVKILINYVAKITVCIQQILLSPFNGRVYWDKEHFHDTHKFA